MNKKEAEKIIDILMEADGVCPYCSRALCNSFIRNFKEFEELTKNKFKKVFNEEFEEEKE